MKPEIWGPHLWFILHLISFEYPENPTEFDKRIYHDFYTSLKDVLPCDMCKKHYRDHITKYPLTPHLDTRDALIKWVIQVHNFINISLGKPIYTVPQVMETYSKIKPISPFATINNREIAKRFDTVMYNKLYILIGLMAIIIIFVKYYFNRYYFSL
jgi:hypothetical protein